MLILFFGLSMAPPSGLRVIKTSRLQPGRDLVLNIASRRIVAEDEWRDGQRVGWPVRRPPWQQAPPARARTCWSTSPPVLRPSQSPRDSLSVAIAVSGAQALELSMSPGPDDRPDMADLDWLARGRACAALGHRRCHRLLHGGAAEAQQPLGLLRTWSCRPGRARDTGSGTGRFQRGHPARSEPCPCVQRSRRVYKNRAISTNRLDHSEALRRDPSLFQAWNNRGVAYTPQPSMTTRPLLDWNASFAEAYLNRGMAYEKRGEDELVLADFTLRPGVATGVRPGLLSKAPAARQAGRERESRRGLAGARHPIAKIDAEGP